MVMRRQIWGVFLWDGWKSAGGTGEEPTLGRFDIEDLELDLIFVN